MTITKKLAFYLKHNPINELYNEADLPKKIRRSLNFIIFGNVMGSFFGIICGGGTTAMIGLATELGANDLAFGVLSAVPQVAALMQLPLSVLVNRTHKRKKYMLTLGIFSRIVWVVFGLIPYIIPMAPAIVQLWTIIFLMGIASGCGAIINVCWVPWMTDLTPISIRGRWLSIRESILAACNVLIGLFVAQLLDTLPPESRYAIIFIVGGTVGVIDMLCFGFCEDVYNAPPQKQSLFGAFRDVLKNKPFMNLTILWVFWSFASNLSAVYMNPYSMNEMGLSFMQIMVFSTIASAIVSIFVMPAWGRMIDRFGCRNVLWVACIMASLAPIFYLFATPGNIWPTLLRNVFGAMFWCGSNLAAETTKLANAPAESRPTHIAVFSCATALGGATMGSLVGGALLEYWNTAGTFDNFIFDRYQVLFAGSIVLRLIFIFIFVPRFAPDKDSTPMDLVRYIYQSIRHPLRNRYY